MIWRVSGGMAACKDPNDPSVARMTKLLTMIPIVYAVVALAILCYFFSDASEKEIMKYARAAKKFQIYNGDSRAASVVLAARLKIQERVATTIRILRAKLPSRRRAWLFQIAPTPLAQPGFRAEKLKILLGFFQIFGGFKRNYEIPWPDEMSRLMDVYSIADFNFIDTTSIECFYKRDYFTSYRCVIHLDADKPDNNSAKTHRHSIDAQVVSVCRADLVVSHRHPACMGQCPLPCHSLDAPPTLRSLRVASVSNAASRAANPRQAGHNGVNAQDCPERAGNRTQKDCDTRCSHEGEPILSCRGCLRSSALVDG